VTKRLVEIDDEVLKQAQEVLGTPTIKDTVNAALRGAVKSASRQALEFESLRRFGKAARDLRNPSVMARAWD
jgi:Arc/MetJ family transcription regulator